MMKKQFISLSVAVLLLVSAFSFAAAAESLDPAAAPPSALSFSFDYPNEGSQRITVNYRIPENACRFVAVESDEKISAFGFDGSYIMQFDWSVDSENDWNYTSDWDIGDGNYIYLDVGVDTIGKGELLWFTYDDAVEKCDGAIKSKKTDSGEKARVFNFAEHQLYIRARFVYFDTESETSYCSAWTDSYSVNDSFNGTGFSFPDNISGLESPVVSNAFYGSSNGENYIYFDISLGSKLTDAAWAVKCATGEDLILKSQIRINDGEWKYWSVEDELYPYTAGLRAFSVDDAMLKGKIEFRCCLSYEGNADAGIDSFSSPWSKNIIRTSDNSFSIVKNVDERKDELVAGRKCSLCGICPQPLGVCVFVWLTLVVIAILVAIIIARAIRRSKTHVDSIETAARERLERGQAEDNARRNSLSEKVEKPAADNPINHISTEKNNMIENNNEENAEEDK